MASGIVHDFNNVLAPIAGFADLLLADLDDAPDGRVDPATTRQYVELIRTGATDAAAVVSRLREFYRPREEADDFVPVDLNRVVERVASLTDRKSTRLNSSHGYISYAVFCLKKKKKY